jgi:hypothetical protein
MSLFQSLRVRRSQGSQFMRDVRTAAPAGFRDLPVSGQLGLALAGRQNELSHLPICNESFGLSYCGHDL